MHYIKAGGSTIAIVKSKDSGGKETRYLHKDHLGGIESITDENGNLVQQLSYDPHGKRRNSDWTDAVAQIPVYDTQRGFTGHEHLDDVGLIHMNGRVYDPTLGRFLSADPFVQFPDNLQSLNRYSYVLNNPLSFTDPSGFGLFSFIKNIFKAVASWVKFVVTNPIVQTIRTIAAGIACGPFGPACAAASAGFNTAVNGGSLGDIAKSAAITFATARAFNGVHNTEGITKVVAHGVIGGVSSELSGGKFLSGFVSGGVTAGFGEYGGYELLGVKGPNAGGLSGGDYARNAAVAAIVGGTASVIGGGKFRNGAITGAFSRLFNDFWTIDPVAAMEMEAEFAGHDTWTREGADAAAQMHQDNAFRDAKLLFFAATAPASEIAAGALAVNIAYRGGRLMRWIPQSFLRSSLSNAGWAVGKMRPKSAARGGWSMTTGNLGHRRVQFSAPGGRHGGAQYKVSGDKIGKIKRRYFDSVNK